MGGEAGLISAEVNMIWRKTWAAVAGFALAAGLAGAAVAQDVPSQPYVWKSVTLGAGGYVPGVEFSPVQKGLMYCRTDIGSCYRSVDSGNTWVPLADWTGVSDYQGGESLAPDPVDPNVVYMAAGLNRGAILRSRDGGKTFDIFPVTFSMGGNSTGRGVGERLGVDPNSPNILYFASRNDGLWVSTDSAATWKKVDSFPVKGAGGGRGGGGGRGAAAQPPPATQPGAATQPAARGARGGGPGGFGGGGGGVGLSVVVFDPSSSAKGQPCQTIYVGNTDPGSAVLYRSSDGGKTWAAIPGEPAGPNLKTAKAELDSTGMLYIDVATAVGPNNGSGGQVWKLNTKSGVWTNISPVQDEAGAFEGLSLDRQHPGTLMVSTFSGRPDDVWRSTDGGATWKSVNAHSLRSAGITPYLTPLNEDRNHPGTPVLGWWLTGTAIDPFDSDHAVYTTGATIWGTRDFTKMDADQTTHWEPEVKGMEETAIIWLTSPTDGPHLISGFGDISSYTHDDFNVSPPMNQPKDGTNCDAIDYAGKNPKVVVKEGNGRNGFSWSEDSGHTWTALTPPGGAAAAGGARAGRGPGGGGTGDGVQNLIVSADGTTFMLLSPTAQITSDRGKTWTPVKGLEAGARVVSDKVNGQKFYSLDTANRQLLTSTDGGATFTSTPGQGLVAVAAVGRAGGRGFGGGGALRLWANPEIEGDIWAVGGATMLHSADGGKTFSAMTNHPTVNGSPAGLDFGFGKAAPGKTFPAIYVGGALNGLTAIWRSDDIGATWIRINDDQHQYGTRYRCVTGDPRIYGRVYVGTDGRGILYGDIAR